MPDQIESKLILTSLSTNELERIVINAVEAVISKSSVFGVNQSEDDEIGGIELAHRITGLAYATIRTKASKNELPVSKPAGTKHLRFKKSELIKWMSEGRRKTNSEIRAEAENFQPKSITKKSRKEK